MQFDLPAVARILVIDDHRDLRELLRAVAKVVITDIFMPNRDGLETIGCLRREHPQVGVPDAVRDLLQ